MKALLIYPPKKHMLKTNVPEFVEQETGVYPPLGLLYVASFVRSQARHEVEVLDCQAEALDYPQIEERIRLTQPDVVGIQAFTFTLIDVILTAQAAKKVNKEILVCLGGPHVNIYPEESMAIPEIDFVILGEGELAFTELLQALEKKQDLSGVKGLFYRDNGAVARSSPRAFITDLDSLPQPQRSLTPYKKYYSLLARGTPITTMMTSRGCPFQCLFCDRPHLGKEFRCRSYRNVVDEMEACLKMGIREIFLYDDTFSVDRKRAMDICDEINLRGLKFFWDIRTRIDCVDKELLRKLKEAGCIRIHYGVESGTEKILGVLRKHIDLKKTKEIFKITRDLGITTLAYFMLGSPSETREDILKTIDFAIALNPDFVHFSLTTPFPCTDLYRLGLESGVLKSDYWKEFSRSPSADFVPSLWEEELSREELIALLDLAYKRFYARPGYIIKELLKIRDIRELLRKVKAGFRVIVSENAR